MERLLGDLITEQVNQNSENIDMRPTAGILEVINAEDTQVPMVIRDRIEIIAKAVDTIVAAMEKGGRLFYIGAGTSGRLGMLDAAECPPTYGVDPSLVQAIIAGGTEALLHAVEGAEDNEELGREAIREAGVTERDVVIGITASGRTPYVLAAMKEAGRIGAKTAGISNNSQPELEKVVDISISLPVGPEVIMGSTRMKAGTSQKMVLNMISTAVMIKLGKVYGNLMVDLRPTNDKLVDRAVRIIMLSTGLEEAEAARYLESSGMNPKVAIVMVRTGRSREAAEKLLGRNGGFVSKALLDRGEV